MHNKSIQKIGTKQYDKIKDIIKMKNLRTHTIVFIHGLFMNEHCWQEWIPFFEKLGFVCHAPSYSYHHGRPQDLRKNPNNKLSDLDLEKEVTYFQSMLVKLPEKPILIGHSMGGLIVQRLIEQDLGIVGICISSAPPQGIFSINPHFLACNLPVINPLKGNRLFIPTEKWFHNAFCHLLDEQQAKKEFNQCVVPESRRMARSALGKAGKINFNKPHSPLLFIAGDQDRIVPAILNKKNVAAYTDPNSQTDFMTFPDKTHLLCRQKNWETIALFILNWINTINTTKND